MRTSREPCRVRTTPPLPRPNADCINRYMLEVLGANQSGTEGTSQQDWHRTWLGSAEYSAAQKELEQLFNPGDNHENDGNTQGEFAMPFTSQLYQVCLRVFQQYWRSPSYIWSKIILGVLSGLFIGFSFYDSDRSIQGIQNVIFSVFGVSAILSPLSEQVSPNHNCEDAKESADSAALRRFCHSLLRSGRSMKSGSAQRARTHGKPSSSPIFW